jgi:hypothetical protein
MELSVPLPADWTIEQGASGKVARVPGTSITITVAPLMGRPDDPKRWAQARLRDGLAPGVALEVVQAVDVQTDDGWPLSVVHTRADGAVRIHLFYTFLVYMGLVVVRADDPAQLEARRQEILDLAGKVTPDFGDPVIALSQIWEGVELRPEKPGPAAP